MTNLLKSDFFALLKSKIMYIVLAICIIFPLFTVLVDFGLTKIAASLEEDVPLDINSLFKARTIMFSNFSLTNNIGLIIPIFAGILLMSDIKNGTIRNKVIIGYSRIKIYLSHLIVSTTFCALMALISFLISCGGSLIFFKYGYPFNGSEVLNIAKCLLIGLLAFAYAASLSTFFALITKSTPMTIIFTLVSVIAVGLASGLRSLLPDKYRYIFYMVPTYASIEVASSGALSNEVFLFGLGSFLLFIAVNSALGIYIFNKTDLK